MTDKKIRQRKVALLDFNQIKRRSERKREIENQINFLLQRENKQNKKIKRPQINKNVKIGFSSLNFYRTNCKSVFLL